MLEPDIKFIYGGNKMPAVEITAALIGAAATGIAAAVPTADNILKNARGNLASSITVFNGTQYSLAVDRHAFRKGAFLGGTEGEMALNPEDILPMNTGVFGSQQIAGATTDVIGYVLYTCDVFDLMIGWHVFDQAGFQRYIVSVIKPRGYYKANSYFDTTWAADLSHPFNKVIWSGHPNKYTSRSQTTGFALKVNGNFLRGALKKEQIEKTQVKGDGSTIDFVTRATGGAKEMQVVVVDEYVDAYYKGDEHDGDLVSMANV
jgi:hypothetical protein